MNPVEEAPPKLPPTHIDLSKMYLELLIEHMATIGKEEERPVHYSPVMICLLLTNVEIGQMFITF